MKILTGHLTETNKTAIKAILNAGLMSGKVGKISYYLNCDNNIYTVKYQTKDRGLIPCAGSQLRLSTYSASFTL
jgi:hypothetical protein